MTQEQLAAGLGISRPRVTQLVAKGMPTSSIEAAKAWRDRRKVEMEATGSISQPVRPINLDKLDKILKEVTSNESSGDNEMDGRIQQQVNLVQMTREVFEQAVQEGDPSQNKLYGNYDRAIATLLRLERERHIRLQESGRLVDAGEVAQRFGKILGELKALIDRAELTFAPAANPDDPPKALKAFRDFRDDVFRRISSYNAEVEIAESVVTKHLPPVEMPNEETEDGESEVGNEI